MKKQINLFSFIYIFLLILISNQIYSTPTNNTSINVDDIIDTQKCYDNIEQKSSTSGDSQKLTVYELNNNSTSNTIFIQYISIKNIIISDSMQDDKSILYKESSDSGFYYLNLNSAKSKYYIILENSTKNHKICFLAFPEKGKEFSLDNNHPNPYIKNVSYEMITSSKLFYYINNNDLKHNKFFYGIRFEEKKMEKINKPKIELDISFSNSERTNEKIEISEWYLQNNYYYALFFVPKLKFKEKLTNIILSLNVELKNELINNETFTFNLELIDSQELTCQFDLNVVSNSNNSYIYPKIFYIDIQKNIYENDRDILILNNDKEYTYIKPFFTSNYNTSNENSILIDKKFIDITQSFLKMEKFAKIPKIDLFILILDENCDKINRDDNIFISFQFYGGYHSLIHYKENITLSKLFNNDKNKIVIKQEHCRTQYFVNYINIENNNDIRILDLESAIGNMNLYQTNEIKGTSLDDYLKKINELPIADFKNSILSGEYNFLVASCPTLDPVMTYIYAHKKNSVEDTLTFINQKSLIHIEYNNQYSFKFDKEEKSKAFDFRIKVLRTNIKESYKIDITYESNNLSIENKNDILIFKHLKESDSKLIIKISSSSSVTNSENTEKEDKGFILEIFKSIDILENDIIYIDKETEKNKIEPNKVILFIYDKEEINSARNVIELYNNYKDSNTKVNICIHSGIGKYPFILKPLCQKDEEENIIIQPKQNMRLFYNNPYSNDNINIDVDENNLFYVSILVDNDIEYSYKYDREIFVDENTYIQLNHNGNKIFKLSKKINQKKSMYYQINLCGNQNSNLKYIFNDSELVTIKNDIYQEFSLDTIKTYVMQFNLETTENNNNNNGLFKYFYGPANLIKTINDFSKEIYISKKTKNNQNNNNDQLLIKFQSPFTDMIDIKIIFVVDNLDKYDDMCSLMKYLENFDKKNADMKKNAKIIEKRIRVRENKENKIEVSVEKDEIKDFLNKNIDIYLLSKSIGSNMEINYDRKSLVIDWNQLSERNDNDNVNEQMKKSGKKVICINCGLYGEQNLDNDSNINEKSNIENINVNNSNNNNDYINNNGNNTNNENTKNNENITNNENNNNENNNNFNGNNKEDSNNNSNNNETENNNSNKMSDNNQISTNNQINNDEQNNENNKSRQNQNNRQDNRYNNNRFKINFNPMNDNDEGNNNNNNENNRNNENNENENNNNENNNNRNINNENINNQNNNSINDNNPNINDNNNQNTNNVNDNNPNVNNNNNNNANDNNPNINNNNNQNNDNANDNNPNVNNNNNNNNANDNNPNINNNNNQNNDNLNNLNNNNENRNNNNNNINNDNNNNNYNNNQNNTNNDYNNNQNNNNNNNNDRNNNNNPNNNRDNNNN